jgi:hypothetical protein
MPSIYFLNKVKHPATGDAWGIVVYTATGLAYSGPSVGKTRIASDGTFQYTGNTGEKFVLKIYLDDGNGNMLGGTRELSTKQLTIGQSDEDINIFFDNKTATPDYNIRLGPGLG